MTVYAFRPDIVALSIGDVWDIAVTVRDANCCLTDTAAVVVTVTLPSGSTSAPTVERVAAGVYRALYTVGTSGRYIARAVAAGYGAADFVAYVEGTTAGTSMPTIADVDAYLGENSWEPDDLQAALDAESAAQRATCRVAAVYPADLREALLRRVARNLALRRNPLGQPQGDAEFNFIPGRDPEVRRLEAPHRKLVFG